MQLCCQCTNPTGVKKNHKTQILFRFVFFFNRFVFYEKTKSKVHQYAKENIVDEDVKIEDEKILDGFKDDCESRFIQGNDENNCIDKALHESQKRKRKDELMINDIKLEIAPPNYDQNKLLEKIWKDYKKIQDWLFTPMHINKNFK